MIRLEHKKIGKYLLFPTKKITQLKHSSIFMGLNTETNTKVLIKVISKFQYEKNQILRNSLDFQLSFMKLITNENILKYKEMITTQKNYYLILQESKGQTFKKIINRKGRFIEKDMRSFLKKLKQTFNFLHKNNIIHGNINTKSFLVEHNQIKLGYPSYYKTIQVIKSNTFQGQFPTEKDNLNKLSDYLYLSPELLTSGMISVKSDIWSLGVVLYETLFGCLPWDVTGCHHPFDVASIMLNQKVNFPINANLTKPMEHFLMNCLEADPEKRFGWDQVIQHDVVNKIIEDVEQKISDSQQISTQYAVSPSTCPSPLFQSENCLFSLQNE